MEGSAQKQTFIFKQKLVFFKFVLTRGLGFIELTKMVQTALSIRSNYKAEKCPLCEDTGSQEVTAALYKDIIGFLADALRRGVRRKVL